MRNWSIYGIGGAFIYSDSSFELVKWYEETLNLRTSDCGGAKAFCTTFLLSNAESDKETYRCVWSVMDHSQKIVKSEKSFMINYKVKNIQALVDYLTTKEVEILLDDEYDNGRFVWIKDIEENVVELWEDNKSTIYDQYSEPGNVAAVSDVIILAEDYKKLAAWYEETLGIESQLSDTSKESTIRFEFRVTNSNTALYTDWIIRETSPSPAGSNGFTYGYWLHSLDTLKITRNKSILNTDPEGNSFLIRKSRTVN